MRENDRNRDTRGDEDRTASREEEKRREESAKRPQDEAGVDAEPAGDGTLVPGSGSAGGP